ncbi:MAG: NAD(P)/FAD-dependent oxidoreductase [Pseudomonadota bacterium]
MGTKKYDAIIIGGGHNGLAAAAILVRRGWRIGVFERNPSLGGAVQTRELTQPGFRHDLAAMNLSQFAGSAFHQEYAEDLARHGLSFAHADDCFASVFPDGRWFGVSKDVSTTVARISEFSAADAVAWTDLLKNFGEDAPHIFSVLGAPMTLSSLAKTGWKIWRQRGSGFILQMIRLLVSSPRKFLDETFESPEIKTTLAAWGMHLDFPPDQSGGALFPYLEAMGNQSFGMVIGKGGAETMIRALAGMIKEAGGDIYTDAPVEEILVKGGKADGVKLRDGTVYRAKKAVIANVAPSALTRSGLLKSGTGNEAFDRGAVNFAHAPGTMMIHLALDGLPDWAAGEQLKKFAYVHLAPSLQMMANVYTQAKNGVLPAEPVLVVGQPTAIDDSRAPEGKHILWIQVRVLPAQISGDEAGEITGREWADVKDAYSARALSILERYAPGVHKKVIGSAVFSPDDLQRENPNLVGGDQIAGSHHLSQNFLFRPVLGWADWKTPVDKLYMVGASTWPGAGVGAGSGTMLANRLNG